MSIPIHTLSGVRGIVLDYAVAIKNTEYVSILSFAVYISALNDSRQYIH